VCVCVCVCVGWTERLGDRPFLSHGHTNARHYVVISKWELSVAMESKSNQNESPSLRQQFSFLHATYIGGVLNYVFGKICMLLISQFFLSI